MAAASRAMVVVADDSKQVPVLGGFDLPLEVGTDDWERVRDELDAICPGPVRLRGAQTPYVTDNGNHMLDCRFPSGIDNPGAVEAALQRQAGVVESGLFLGMATGVIVAGYSGVRTLERGDA